MSYIQIELARTIQADKLREAERRRRLQEALAARQGQSMSPVQTLGRSMRKLTKEEQHVAPEPTS
jgi:hypothetical protein